MPKELFLASDFVATKFSTGADKADFGNLLLHFIDSGWKQTIFTEKFYSRLSMCFGHIAHCDRSGFYETWFSDDHQRLRFLQHALASHCWGSPEFTFSDVERAVQHEIRHRNYVALYELRAAESLLTAKMAVLQRLEAKYRTSPQQTSQNTEDQATFNRARQLRASQRLLQCRLASSNLVAPPCARVAGDPLPTSISNK